jgi:hypothetical protein
MKSNRVSVDVVESKQGVFSLGQSWLHFNESKQGLIGLDWVCSLV